MMANNVKGQEDELTGKGDSVELQLDKVVFPPAATWYRTNATASRDDMWAYLAGQAVVLVIPKIIHTKVVETEEYVRQIEDDQKLGNVKLSGSADRIWPDFEVFGQQREHYSCVSFCQSSWDHLPVKEAPLVTGCKEGYIRIWNVKTKQCIMFHDVHKQVKNVSITAVDWSKRNPWLIYSMDEDGTLVTWQVNKGKLKTSSFGKIQPSCLHSSPHDDHIIVFGTKGGNIFIAETNPKGKGGAKILHKVRHDEEVVSTLWCPDLDWSSKIDSRSQTIGLSRSILASSIQSSKAPTIRLWSGKAEDKGIFQVWEKEKTAKIFRNFSPLAWVRDPNSGSPMLITSSKHGNILSYSEKNISPELIHDVHQHSAIFGLVQCGDVLWSTSYEPVIVGWNLRTMVPCCVVPTFKGVCAIVPSPSVGNIVGIAGNDATIRIVNFENDYPLKNCIKEPNVSHRLRSKIMALAWHPEKDNLIGFGTDDGVLGVFEVRENHKHALQFDRRVSGCVYAVDWGPSVYDKTFQPSSQTGGDKKENEQSSLLLYACGGNSVHMIYTGKPSNPLVNVSKIIDCTNPQSTRFSGIDGASLAVAGKATDIRWAPDFSLLAVGYNDGRVELYTPPYLELKCWIKCHARAIQYLSWRPYDFVQKSLTDCHKARWFATASNDATARLFNLEEIFKKNLTDENTNIEPTLIISSAATLRTLRGERIISLAWSPHDPNLLVTVSYDNTGVVWNITDGTPIARYFGHLQRLVACAFHPTHKYKVITASDEFMNDCTVHVWDYRHHPYQISQPPPPVSKRSADAQPLHVKSKEQIEFADAKNEEVDAEQAVVEVPLEDPSSRIHISDQTVAELLGLPGSSGSGKKKESRKKAGKSQSLLPSTANVFVNSKLSLESEIRFLVDGKRTCADNVNGSVENIQRNEDGLETNSSEDEDTDKRENDLSMIHLGVLGGFDQCVDLMKLECESHMKKGDWEKACCLATWMGDTTCVEKIVEQGKITETIIQCAKTLSKHLFVSACEKYAEMLVHQDEFSKAATYLVLAGKREKATELLVGNKLYRDAMALLKMNMGSKNVLQWEVTKKWLSQLVQDGNFEVAAKIYCSIGMYGDALAVIEKRDTPYSWKTGMYLASKCNDTKKRELLGLKYSEHCMMMGNHSEAKEVLRSTGGVEWLLLLVETHENIFHLSNAIRDAMRSPAIEDLPTYICNIKEIITGIVSSQTLDGAQIVEKLKKTVMVSIAQNQMDAEMILTRTLLLRILGDPELQDLPFEESLQLSKVWLEEKALYHHLAYVKAFQSL